MFDFQRQHPVAAVSRAFSLIKGNLVTIIVFLVVGARSESFPFLWWIGGGFAFLLVVGVANWWRFLFKIEEGELHIKSGIFVRKNLYLSKDRVQVIDITSGVIQRLFGLVRVDIQTAGSSSREAAIDAISLDKAREINRLLRDEDSESEEGEESVSQVESAKKEFGLPGKELLIAASTSGSFGIALSILATVFSQVEPLISESELFEYVFEILPSQTDVVFFVTVIVIFVVFAWLLSFFSTLFSYGNFSLTVKEKEMVITRGIFEKKRVTVPYNRIQAIHVAEGMIRQPLGYTSLHLESAGYGDEKGTGSIVLFPLVKRSEVLQLLNEVVPSYQKEMDGLKLPKRALRRYLFRSTFFITAAIVPLYFWLSLNNWIWLIPALAMLWGWLKYRAAAVGWNEGSFIFRSRTLSKSTAFINRNRIQNITISQSPFQRWRKLCTAEIHVASGDRGKSFSVRDLEARTGVELMREMKIKKGSDEISEPFENSDRILKLPGWNQAAN
ncbi:PH domain-containing protein [Rhodohalobacter sp.]|uniref:PH domain-containing protein n=1 Tax=Rhodohalobacter sp. TaxID=1974210 RepID=UPI002ACE8DC4|nr:PH domain-containing protein [Rhodohalobacter sp.]MDZ7758364.1 PH domain-containing protein [Rhodohalobacter sp.]